MLLIDGVIRIMPLSIAAEGGAISQADGTNQPAVILTAQTQQGFVQTILPPENIDSVIEALQAAKEEANAIPKTDLVIANESDMKQAAQLDQINKDIIT